MRKRAIIVLLVVLALACNFPGFPSAGTPMATSETEPGPEGEESPVPSDTATLTPESGIADTPTSTTSATPTVTATLTPTPTLTLTPTSESVKPGPPLTFLDPPWELLTWREDAGDWVGTIRARIAGGTPPYQTQLENQEIVSGLEVPARWRLCKPMPATLRVWSADNQFAQKTIWVYEIGCAP